MKEESGRHPQISSGRFRIPQWGWNAASLVIVLTPAFIPGLVGDALWAQPGSFISVAGAVGAVVARIRYPQLSLLLALGFTVLCAAVGGAIVACGLATLICVFSVGNRTDRRWTILAALVSGIALSAAGLFYIDDPWQDVSTIFQVFAYVGAVAAVGDASRSRRAFFTAMTERARRAEETKESEARRRVAEERVTIARDLHDVLAHQIAVINLHAAVASDAVRSRPDDAEESLATVRRAARSVLGEIGNLLSVLRSTDVTPDVDGRLRPVPSLSEVDALIEGYRANGLDVDVRVVGERFDWDGASSIVAYRILQEALTNAHKHGVNDSALLHIEYLADEVVITVTNTVDYDARTVSTKGGYGLIGIRERARSVGGRTEVEPGPGPIFRLTAWLPVSVRESPSETAPATDDRVRASGSPMGDAQ